MRCFISAKFIRYIYMCVCVLMHIYVCIYMAIKLFMLPIGQVFKVHLGHNLVQQSSVLFNKYLQLCFSRLMEKLNSPALFRVCGNQGNCFGQCHINTNCAPYIPKLEGPECLSPWSPPVAETVALQEFCHAASRGPLLTHVVKGHGHHN